MVRLTLIAAAIFALGVAATPVNELRATQDTVCGDYIGSCYENDCGGVFAEPSDQLGTCSTGTYAGCPCRKCGGTNNDYTGPCTDNGCMGIQGTCSAGDYEGCPCN